MKEEQKNEILAMSANDIAEAWKDIIQIYNETRAKGPKVTISDIVAKYGIGKTKEIFATVAAIKKHDGRIYGINREYMNNIPVNPQIVEWRSGNPVIYDGLEDIHTTHIDQLITELRELDKQKG